MDIKKATLKQESPDGVWFCESCTRRFTVGGDCTMCEEEPLLDLRNSDVIEMLQDFDTQRWRKRFGQFALLVGGITFGAMLLGVLLGSEFDLRAGLIGGGAITFAGATVLMQVFAPPKRCPTGSELPRRSGSPLP